MGKLLWTAIVMMLLVSGCGWNGTPTRENDITPITSITIMPEYTTIAANTTTKLTVLGDHAGYFTDDVTDLVEWTVVSGAAEFNSVVPNRVKGTASGTVKLKATVKSNGVYTETQINVSSATISSIDVTPATVSVPKGLSQQFKAVGTFSDGVTTSFAQDITFDATWASSAPNIATVSDDEASKGMAKTAVDLGTTQISAAFSDGNGNSASKSADMTVTNPVVTSITVSPSNPTVLSVATKQFTATGTYSDGTIANITSLASWNSSNGTLATMSGSVATTLAPGTVTITAGMDGVSGGTTLTVTGGSLSSISVTPLASTLVKDTKTRITAIGTFSNGSTRDISGAVSWSVDDTARATVTQAGGNLVWLNALADTPSAGVVEVTATGKSVEIRKGTSTISIASPALSAITLSAHSLSMAVQNSSQLTATATFSSTPVSQDVTYSDNSTNNSNCSWSSSNTAVATVGNDGITKGRVTGIAVGSAVITADYGGRTDSATVTITAPDPLNVKVSCPASVSVGNRVSCSVTASYGDGSSQIVTAAATAWTVGSENILAVADSINQPGDFIGVSGGSTTLAATFNGMTAPAVTIIVTP